MIKKMQGRYYLPVNLLSKSSFWEALKNACSKNDNSKNILFL